MSQDLDFAEILREDARQALRTRLQAILEETSSRLKEAQDLTSIHTDLQAYLELASQLDQALKAWSPGSRQARGTRVVHAPTPAPSAPSGGYLLLPDLYALVNQMLLRLAGRTFPSRSILQSIERQVGSRIHPELLVTTPRSGSPRWRKRVCNYLWALHNRGWLSSPYRGVYRLTDKGLKALQGSSASHSPHAPSPAPSDADLRRAFLEVLTSRPVAHQSTRALSRSLASYLVECGVLSQEQASGEAWDHQFAQLLSWAMAEGAVKSVYHAGGPIPEVVKPLPRARELLTSWSSNSSHQAGGEA